MLLFTFIASFQRQIIAEHPAEIIQRLWHQNIPQRLENAIVTVKLFYRTTNIRRNIFRTITQNHNTIAIQKLLGEIASDYCKLQNSGDLLYRYAAISLYTCSILASNIKAGRFLKKGTCTKCEEQ